MTWSTRIRSRSIKIARATTDIQHTPGSAGTHLVGYPAAVEVVVTPRMAAIEPVNAREQGHDTTVTINDLTLFCRWRRILADTYVFQLACSFTDSDG
ncbi:hypothetical protein [Nocardia sp. MDA0666]|uniref:hypothetical protein n=1 Tax=Nocardia sp. MDA0666 TaxID=2135448 RepID=UPI0011B28384|nr:hypothetical protein [Nocardia sp. MDA0666]